MFYCPFTIAPMARKGFSLIIISFFQNIYSPMAGADFLAALLASCFLEAFPPVDFLAVCFVPLK
jgi:hypothetical protein